MTSNSDRDVSSCPSCGARVPAEADVCDLCGTPVEADIERSREAAPVPAASGADEGALGEEGGVFCNQCGWKNPLDARFCSRCGTKLQDLDAATPVARPASVPPASAASAGTAATQPQTEVDDRVIGKQVGILVGAGLLLVVALFLINVVSKGGSSGTASAPAASPGTAGTPAAAGPSAEEILSQIDAPPVPPQVAERAGELRGEIERLDDQAAAVRRRELVDLYLGAGLLGRAAVEQRHVAEQQGTFDAWRRAGDRLYDWMETVEGAPQMDVANLTVEAYERALSINPGDADVRTDLATAYLRSSTPMQGVQQIKQVLEADPDHVQANFNYGYMLMLINRLDQAEAQFVRVQELVEPESPFYGRAGELLEVIREEQSGAAGS